MKVVIGMSGGVDSSVAAYLLKKQGYEVIGLFMRNWDASVNNDIMGNPTLNNNICPQEQDYNDAKEVCKKLDIPLHRVDFVKEYWEYVFTYFLDELKNGRTPNPDIMCNKYIKFDLFIKEAKKLGATYIATGHYARMKDGKLLRGVDLNKDQTYFLSQLTHEQLENVLFPVGDLNKPEVREIAKELGLNTATKKDSTGICFIGERNFKEFLKNYLPNIKGDIINIETNEKVGEHIGLMYYTIGQRRGLDIGGTKDKLFTVGKDLNKNILYVAIGEDNEYLYSDSCIINEVNFNCDERPTKCTAKFRYRQNDYPVTLTYLDSNEILVKYDGVKSVTPGQACVLYDGEVCLGGGIIKEVRKNNKKLWYLL
ncbi:tRNA-specific 2-thiouridylase MnmA [Clostridium sp. CAG:1193]|jgi:tRNA-specific 2-thiouridylase|nr:tRNA-specific 2-thiouridylase MnmA [Clostridium sp. CAG:1193]